MDIENIDELELELENEPQDIDLDIIPTGTEGLSAYEVAVKEGFEGTESEWLESLKGEVGDTPDISIGTTQTLPAGSNAIVTKSGTIENPIFSFGIPRGIQGTIGATPELQVGTVTSGNESEVTITGTTEEPILNFVLEKGDTGETGATGQDGFSPTANISKSGKTATITITDKNGTTTTTIQDGENGSNGADGFSPTASVSKSGNTSTITITDKNGTTTTTINDGINGQDGEDGVGVPSGGTAGQVLAKASGTDYDTEWIDVASGGGEKTIYDFDLPSNYYWSTSGTVTKTASQLTTTQAEQIQAMLEAGFTNIVIRLKFEPNYPYSLLVNLSTGGTDGTLTEWTYRGLFIDSLNNTYGAKFVIRLSSGAFSQLQITFDKNEGYIRTTRIKTAKTTSAGNVYDVTYINSVVGDIESLLGGI